MIRRWLIKQLGGQVPRKAIPTEVRRAVYRRDGLRCRYCGSTDGPFELDHVIPVSYGGNSAADNLVVSCAACNREKGAKRWKVPARGRRFGLCWLAFAFIAACGALCVAALIVARDKPLLDTLTDLSVLFVTLVCIFGLLAVRKILS